MVVFIGFFIYKSSKVAAPNDQSVSAIDSPEPPKQKTGDFKIFTGEEFFKLYDSFVYPNTQLISEHSPITGNELADNRMRVVAVEKGYKLRSAPVTDAFVEVQKICCSSVCRLSLAGYAGGGKTSGLSMSLSAAFRAAEDQRAIFLDRIRGISLDAIAAGTADADVAKVLDKTALAGYSRHHTGYTIDIQCDNDPVVKFEKSKCFTWLNKNNYLNAKTYGWIPSYPEGTGKQGPEPESWEYVWVGENSLRE